MNSLSRLIGYASVALSILHSIFFGIPVIAQADDGAIEAVGGTIRLLNEHPSIQLIAEFVHARVAPSQVRVECVFFLRNSGPATRVNVGFPCTSHGADVDHATAFQEFHSYVDGESVSVREVADTTLSGDQFYRSWWVKDVSFRENEFKSFRNVYVAEPGMSYPNLRYFQYELATGATWAGNISIGDVVLTLEGVALDSLEYIDPEPSSRANQELRWHFKDLNPVNGSRLARIHVMWRQ